MTNQTSSTDTQQIDELNQLLNSAGLPNLSPVEKQQALKLLREGKSPQVVIEEIKKLRNATPEPENPTAPPLAPL